MKHGIGAIQLIGETLRDSPAIFAHNYKRVIEEIIDLCDEIPVENSRKATYMHYLCSFMRFGESIHKENQITIITHLTERPSERSLIYLF
jgi:hypothetical protein